jgi:hypothetical protein
MEYVGWAFGARLGSSADVKIRAFGVVVVIVAKECGVVLSVLVSKLI